MTNLLSNRCFWVFHVDFFSMICHSWIATIFYQTAVLEKEKDAWKANSFIISFLCDY